MSADDKSPVTVKGNLRVRKISRVRIILIVITVFALIGTHYSAYRYGFSRPRPVKKYSQSEVQEAVKNARIAGQKTIDEMNKTNPKTMSTDELKSKITELESKLKVPSNQVTGNYLLLAQYYYYSGDTTKTKLNLQKAIDKSKELKVEDYTAKLQTYMDALNQNQKPAW